MRPKAGQTVDLRTHKRYVQLAASHAVSDVYDALVELITNADDSYHDLYRAGKRSRDGGDVLIEHEERRRGARSLIHVRDKAAGMDGDALYSALAVIGEYSGDRGSRGYMGRGAKDCTAIGDLTYESVVDGRYYRASITHTLEFTLEVDGQRINDEIRERLGIPHGNGTSATIRLRDGLSLPRLSSLQDNLPQHFALRDLMSESSDTRVLIRREQNGAAGRATRLVYRPPVGELVVDEVFGVPGYDEVTASLRIWRTQEELPDSSAGRRFDLYGILVQAERAIHENCIPAEGLKREHGIQRYFGVLQCSSIDTLLREYEKNRRAGAGHPKSNPSLLIDPNRKGGLERHHPFTKALMSRPAERLRELLAEDRRKASERQREIGDFRTRAYLDRLGKLVSRFMQQKLENGDFSEDDVVDIDSFIEKGILLSPTYTKIEAGKSKRMRVLARKQLFHGKRYDVAISYEEPSAIRVASKELTLEAEEDSDRVSGTFTIEGLQPVDVTLVAVETPSGAKAEALVSVGAQEQEEHEFSEPLEFRHAQFTVQVGRKRNLRLFAKVPNVVEAPATVRIRSEGKGFVLKGDCKLTPIKGAGFAVGSVTVEGRALGGKGTVIAEIGNFKARAKLKVVDRKKPGSPIRIQIVDEDFVGFRAKWGDQEGRPNLLLVGAKHKAVARYLGPSELDWPGQHSPLFRAILAEIVGESTCRRILERDAEQRPWQFGWADLKRDPLIAGDVIARLQRLLRDFLVDAHAVMLTSSEARRAWEDQPDAILEELADE